MSSKNIESLNVKPYDVFDKYQHLPFLLNLHKYILNWSWCFDIIYQVSFPKCFRYNWKYLKWNLSFLLLNQEYSHRIRPKPRLLMLWLIMPLGDHQSWSWLCRKTGSCVLLVKISTICELSMSRDEGTCKYIFVYPQQLRHIRDNTGVSISVSLANKQLPQWHINTGPMPLTTWV